MDNIEYSNNILFVDDKPVDRNYIRGLSDAQLKILLGAIYETGYNDGYDTGCDVGYDNGYSDGYYDHISNNE